ncbi:MAG: hypothetical protein KGR24_05930 [Planctomycetes bacterium]|nr:hypothetical protein [Planctomycetota bacterium]
MDPRSPVRPGQPLALAAEQVNWINRQMRGDSGFRAGEAASVRAPFTALPCQNVSGQDVPLWGVLRISGLAITPTSDATATATKEFQMVPVLQGDTPTASTNDAFVIAVQPIRNGTIGQVAVDGVVQVKLDVLNAADATAGPKANSRTELQTGGGNATILWKQSGTGSGKWGLVRLGGRTMKFGTISSTWTKLSTKTVTEQNGDGTARTGNPTFTATNHFADVTVASGTKRVACALVDSTWILIAAEC